LSKLINNNKYYYSKILHITEITGTAVGKQSMKTASDGLKQMSPNEWMIKSRKH
jgi:hypothetical protein